MKETKKQIIAKMQGLFCPPEGTPPTGGKQSSNRNQYPTTKEIDLSKHISGKATYAIDVVYKDKFNNEYCKWGVIDIDEKDGEGLKKANAIKEYLEEQGIHTLMSFSGNKGYHVYILTEPVPKGVMKIVLQNIKVMFSFKGETIPGDGFRCKPAPCLHQTSGNMSYLFGRDPYPEPFNINSLPEGFYEQQLSLLEDVIPTPANLLILFALKDQKTKNQGEIESMTPDLSQGDEYITPCIIRLIENGGSESLGTYDKNNLTLDKFCASKNLSSEISRELAETMARNSEDGPVETTKDYNAKIGHFKSIRNTPSVKEGAFNCTYMLKARKELKFDCAQCRVRPEGIKVGSNIEKPTQKEAISLEKTLASDLLAYIVQKGTPPQEIDPGIMPKTAYLTQFNLEGQPEYYEYSIILTALNAGVTSGTSLALWLDSHLMKNNGFLEFFIGSFKRKLGEIVKGSDSKSLIFYTEFKNHVMDEYKKLKKTELISEDEFEETLQRASDLSTRYRISKKAELLQAECLELTKDIQASSSDFTHDIGKILSSSQQGAVVPLTDKAESLLEYILGNGGGRVGTPFTVLNDLTGGGFANGTLTILVSPPGGGKTTIASQIADYSASGGVPTLFISMEMSKEQMFVNSMARGGNINSSKITSPYPNIKDTVMNQVGELAEKYFETTGKYLYVIEGTYSTSPASVSTMVSKIRADHQKSKNDPFLVVIDYLQLLNTGVEAMDIGPNETQKISELAVKVKQLARDSNVAVLALSDVTKEEQKRTHESKELTLNSLRGSNRIGHAADTVMALYSESAEENGGKAKKDPWDVYVDKVNSSENAGDFVASIQRVKKDTKIGGDSSTVYARIELIKNRAGQGRGSQFLLYHRAYHKFEAVSLPGQEKAEGRA